MRFILVASLCHASHSRAVCSSGVGDETSLMQMRTLLLHGKGHGDSQEWQAKSQTVLEDPEEDGSPTTQSSNKQFGTPSAHLGLVQDLREYISAFLQRMRYDYSKPIVVTALDRNYKHYSTRWTERLNRMGLTQQCIVAFDDESSTYASSNALPMLSVTSLSSPLFPGSHEQVDSYLSLNRTVGKEGFVTMDRWKAPALLGIVKFLVPQFLLEDGFKSVIFSEADVFMFSNPLTSSAMPVTNDFTAMLDSPIKSEVNIGFMIFAGAASVDLLKEFTTKWSTEFLGNESTRYVGFDQKVFNQLLDSARNLTTTRLNQDEFAVRPTDVTARTQVVHMAFSSPQCKFYLLDLLYSDQHVCDPLSLQHIVQGNLSQKFPPPRVNGEAMDC
jgi:hypothetical protein